MKNFFSASLSGVTLLAMLGMLTGCETSDHGSGTTNHYYGGGYYDPGYYGDYHGDYNHNGDVIVVPPPGGRPDNGLRPSHPIVVPPQARPTPRPSIPTTPRPAFRGGGGGGGRGGRGR